MFRGVGLSSAVLIVWMSAAFHGAVTADRDSRASLELVNKGYQNVLIGISERVPETEGLVDRLKEVLTEASKYLFQTTKGRAYFKDVYILVPESWKESPDYSDVAWQRYDQSDVIIDTPSETSGNRPYVYKATPCGEPGLFIHLTPDYLLSENIAMRYGPYDKTLIHEWAHYRWGVFDEYPLDNGQHFYADAEGNIEAVRCVSKIKGRRVNPRNDFGPCQLDDNGMPERDCRFLDDTTSTDYTGSLMYKQFLTAISTFCEKAANGVPEGNVHNREAPNTQNIQCQGKSIWEVILKHRDFAPGKGENNANGGDGEEEFDDEPVPEFTVVKKQSSRLVLVLDRSGSMKGQRLRQLRQAAELLITQILADGVKLGIVEFSRSAEVNSELVTINDASRQSLLTKIPRDANGATSIGAGILSGLDVLKDGSESLDAAAGGKMLVITDGDENRQPFISDVLHVVNGSSITIDTIAIGPDASPHLELLSSVTGGTAYQHDEETNSLSDAFSKSSTTDKGITSTPVAVYTDFIQIPAGRSFTGAAFVDSTIGHNTQFLFGHSEQDSITVHLTDPDGVVLTENSTEYDANTDFLRIRFTIGGNAKIGLWTFEVQNRRQELENVTILVQSHARENQDPIMIQARWGLTIVVPPQTQSLYVSVGQGYTPVVDADVKAVVDLPCGNNSVTLRPNDNGIGADVRKDDGVYSAYFIEFCGQGRYGVNVEVNNNGDVTSIASGSLIGVGSAPNPEYLGDDGQYQPERILRSTGDFRRVTIGGSFKCEGSHICNGSRDLYPPARITDLRASNVDLGTKEIRLSFTAPGDDLSMGRASRYIIVMSRSVSEIYDNFDKVPEIPAENYIEGNTTMPRNAGETEVFVIKVKDIGAFSYAFAVMAIDDDDNRSELSNVATSSARMPEGIPLVLVIGCSVAAILIVILLVTAAICLRRRKQKAGGKDKDPPMTKQKGVEEGLGKKHQAPGNPCASQQALRPPSVSQQALRPPSVSQQALRPPSVSQPALRPPSVSQQALRPTSELYYDTASHDADPVTPLYDQIISRKEKDPNWDPTLPNNSEGGGANIKTGHVANARAVFDNHGFIK